MKLWLIPFFPLGGFLSTVSWPAVLEEPSSTCRRRLRALSFLWVLKTISAWALNTPYTDHYFTWIQSGALNIGCDFVVDRLTAVMLLVVTGVGS